MPQNAQYQPKFARPVLVSLFCGAGGMDLGFKQAGFKVRIAFDISSAAIRSHSKNFPSTRSVAADLKELQPAGVVQLALEEIPAGSRIGLIGGPPCQGFSRANSNSSANDPRNSLPLLYLEIVKALQAHFVVEFVVLENVPGIRDKKHSLMFSQILDNLASLHFDVTERELCATDFGVPQNRKRVVICGLRSNQGYGEIIIRKIRGLITVESAIGFIREQPEFFRPGLDPSKIEPHPNHWTMKPKSQKFQLGNFDKSGRSFRRLRWDAPSPTIAFGNREIHVHPDGTRRLSIFEAMLLQGFPPSFTLEGNLSQQVEQVSNAVPPQLAKSMATALNRAMAI